MSEIEERWHADLERLRATKEHVDGIDVDRDVLEWLEKRRAECETLRECLRECLRAMEFWGSEEDGIPNAWYAKERNPWKAYQQGRAALGEGEGDE